jgi:hypothetical protein
MMTAKDYLGDINGGSLMPRESQIIAGLLLQDLTKEEWDHKLIEENVLQRNTPNTSKRVASTISIRLKPLTREFWQSLADADKNTANQLALLATLINSPILADFMRNVLADACRLYQEKLTHRHWDDFLEARYVSLPDLNQFSPGTLDRIRNNIIRVLSEADYLASARSKKIQGVFILPDVILWAEKLGREDLIKVMECK